MHPHHAHSCTMDKSEGNRRHRDGLLILLNRFASILWQDSWISYPHIKQFVYSSISFVWFFHCSSTQYVYSIYLLQRQMCQRISSFIMYKIKTSRWCAFCLLSHCFHAIQRVTDKTFFFSILFYFHVKSLLWAEIMKYTYKVELFRKSTASTVESIWY